MFRCAFRTFSRQVEDATMDTSMAKVETSECLFPGKAKCCSETVQAPPSYSVKLVYLDLRGDGDTADRKLVCEFGFFRLIV